MRYWIVTIALWLSSRAWAKGPRILRSSFNGWKLSPARVKTSSDPAAADAADFAVLKEYGFTDFQSATYSRGGRMMQVKAAPFADASGAFVAFTFYRQPQMQTEQIGDGATSNNSRSLFHRGNILVDVTLQQITAMTAAAQRDQRQHFRIRCAIAAGHGELRCRCHAAPTDQAQSERGSRSFCRSADPAGCCCSRSSAGAEPRVWWIEADCPEVLPEPGFRPS